MDFVIEPHHRYATSDGRTFGFDPGATRKPIDQRGTESALAVRIGGLRSHEETREAARESILRLHERRAVAMHTPGVDAAVAERAHKRILRVGGKRAARKIHMAAKRRRGWR